MHLSNLLQVNQLAPHFNQQITRDYCQPTRRHDTSCTESRKECAESERRTLSPASVRPSRSEWIKNITRITLKLFVSWRKKSDEVKPADKSSQVSRVAHIEQMKDKIVPWTMNFLCAFSVSMDFFVFSSSLALLWWRKSGRLFFLSVSVCVNLRYFFHRKLNQVRSGKISKLEGSFMHQLIDWVTETKEKRRSPVNQDPFNVRDERGRRTLRRPEGKENARRERERENIFFFLFSAWLYCLVREKNVLSLPLNFSFTWVLFFFDDCVHTGHSFSWVKDVQFEWQRRSAAFTQCASQRVW